MKLAGQGWTLYSRLSEASVEALMTNYAKTHPLYRPKGPVESLFKTTPSMAAVDERLGPDDPADRSSPLVGMLAAGLQLDHIETEQQARKLRLFVEAAWPIVEPNAPFVGGWHIDCICEHLEAVTKGELLRLIINVPPRSGKSSLVSVMWPVWSWIKWPGSKWLCATYHGPLTTRDAVRSRRLIQSAWYQQRWSDRFSLTGDQNEKSRYENDKTGYRLSTSVGGVGTGEGGDVVVADDPQSVKDAESIITRDEVVHWWTEVMSTRYTKQSTFRRVIIQQRVHEEDLTGYLMGHDGTYHHLVLPAEYERKVISVAKGDPQPHKGCPIYEDPRVNDGDLLWSGMMNTEQLIAQKAELGPYAAAGQLQQRPTPREGVLFKVNSIRALPIDFDVPTGDDRRSKRQGLRMLQAWDLAYSEREKADFTQALTGGVDRDGNLYILDRWRQRIAESSLDAEMAPVINSSGARIVGIEEGAYRQTATRDLVKRLQKVAKGARVVPVKVTSDKYMRAQLPAGRINVGMVFADKSAPWWPDFSSGLTAFPLGAHDEDADTLSLLTHMAVTMLPSSGERPASTAWSWRTQGQERQAWDPFAPKPRPDKELIRG
jgi:predicted phage terminase large subunit-like protein